MQETASEIIKDTTPLITNDTVVFGILMICLGLIFFTSSRKSGIWYKFYKIVPALFVAYFVPAILTTAGLIAPEWTTIDDSGVATEGSTSLYYMSSRYLLPAALVLMTLSIDLKGVFNLGPKAVIMFLTGTVGIILGGPIAILIVGTIYPEAIATPLTPAAGLGETNEIWAGLSTLSGSWIGGGANQTAMFEIYGYNPKLFGQMVFVDIVVANIWMALLLIGIGKAVRIDKWLNSDTSAIERLKEKVSKFSKKVERNPSFTDLMILSRYRFWNGKFSSFWRGIY